MGASMYHALAGKPPYDIGDNVMGAMYRIVHEEPPRLRTAGWLGPLLEMTMTRDPQQRPAMAEVRDYLRAPASAHDTQLMPVAPPPPLPPAGPPSTTTTDSRPPSAPEPVPAVAPVPPAPPSEGRDRRAGLVAVVGGGVVALLVLLAAVLLLGNNGDDTPAAQSGGGPSTSGGAPSSTGGSSSSGSTATSAPAPTAAELESFAESYLHTASTDPAAGFDQLTPAYQQRSPQYQEFWGSVAGVKVLGISADPSNMRVTYTYSYHLKGSGSEKHTDRVTLFLVRKGDQILIADATSSPA
jgi:hypothetical protein